MKTFGSDNVLKITTSYLIDDDSDDADLVVRESLVGGLSSLTNQEFNEDETMVDDNSYTISSSSKVGATIADDIQNSSIYSGVLALVAIFIYILIRFRKWQFSIGAVVALFHDTLFVLSAFSIANLFGISYEVDQVFIAALLTIIGYSINDTVVVFDRVRENLGIKAGSEVIPVVNESINKTISRTLITSLTTFVVVLVLFLFGGPSLSGFSFALLIGIIVGIIAGLIHGNIVNRFTIPSFIVTLGAMLLWKGGTLLYHGAKSLRYKYESETYKTVLTGDIGVIDASFLWFIGVGIVFYFIVHHHKIGNHFFAVGGNPEAAIALSLIHI